MEDGAAVSGVFAQIETILSGFLKPLEVKFTNKLNTLSA
jgi:hypothetical protein